ncbi:hypothetical protein DYU11_18310 [Fibrisoma montanum]|uniref:Uncharacterized protein n=1 Tax=Fibrisoma montanum TaxID=2305895 RepID=A0A418M620_9BACT|nr:hypothetical protein [Fibrisoma montanum]RIV21360.1 hypothetical protein DYU11_18310 [Fibrisoma montanum]
MNAQFTDDELIMEPKLTVEKFDTKRNYCELKIIVEIDRLITFDCISTLAGFERELRKWMNEASTGTNGTFHGLYRVERKPGWVDIWHRSDAKGDRLVCKVTYIDKSSDPVVEDEDYFLNYQF